MTRKPPNLMSASPSRTLPHRRILPPATIPRAVIRRAAGVTAARIGAATGEGIVAIGVETAAAIEAADAVDVGAVVVPEAVAAVVITTARGDEICLPRNMPRLKVNAILAATTIAARTIVSPALP